MHDVVTGGLARSATVGGTPVALLVALAIAITLGGLFAPVGVNLASLLVAIPAFTAAFASMRFNVGVTVACAAGAVIDAHNGLLYSPVLVIHVCALLVVAGFRRCPRCCGSGPVPAR